MSRGSQRRRTPLVGQPPDSADPHEESVMTSQPGFTVDIDHNPYLPVNGREVSAIVTVTADGTGDTRPPSP
jgi:hypothetical protein